MPTTHQNSLFDSVEPTKIAIPEAPSAPSAKVAAPRKARAIKSQSARKTELDAIYKNLVDGLKSFFQKNNFKRGVLGLSGGADSALTLKIAVDALGANNVTALIMPELGLSKQENIDHAKALCKFFAVNAFYQPINAFLSDFNITPWKPTNRAQMNTKARVRAVLLYSFANSENALVLGTSNLSEILLGYGTKYGDMAADVEVIGSLYKTEVVEIADHIGLPPEIVYKTPSAELAPGQTDEEELGARYADMDKVLAKLDLGADGCIAAGLPPALVHLVFRRVEENKHKRELPAVIREPK